MSVVTLPDWGGNKSKQLVAFVNCYKEGSATGSALCALTAEGEKSLSKLDAIVDMLKRGEKAQNRQL